MSQDAAAEVRGWRVGHQGRDRMYYEERHDGRWERIDIDGEMLTGRAHHLIYFASAEQWQRYPAWARHRRDAIIARVKSEFREPAYEYYGDQDPVAALATPGAAARPSRATVVPSHRGRQGASALLVAVTLLLVLAGAMGWLVARGVSRGEVPMPLKQTTLRRAVSRQAEPAMFWFSTGVYAVVGVGALGLGGLGLREWRRP